MDRRYEVRPWMIGNSQMFCVWDLVEGKREIASPVWITRRYAQEDANKLNAREGNENVSSSDRSKVATAEPDH